MFVGIDFGTHGSGLAYALPDGKSYIHNMWDNELPSVKPRTSVLLNKDSEVVTVGSDALKLYLKAKKEIAYQLFERFKMNLYEKTCNKAQLYKVDEKNMDEVDLKEEVTTANDQNAKAATQCVFVAQLVYLKEQAFEFIKRYFARKCGLTGDSKKGWNEVQYFLTVPGMSTVDNFCGAVMFSNQSVFGATECIVSMCWYGNDVQRYGQTKQRIKWFNGQRAPV